MKRMFGKMFARRENSHKGDFGAVLVIGGSASYAGAPSLVAQGALRGGCDLVYLLVPEKIYGICASFSPNFIVRDYPGQGINDLIMKKYNELKHKADILVIGNGLGIGLAGLEERKEQMENLLKIISDWGKLGKNAVIDADALQEDALPYVNDKFVLTPHSKEFERIFKINISKKKIEEKKKTVQQIAGKIRATILLKGAKDIISDGKKTFLNNTGNPGMTVGGTGDALAGLTASLLVSNSSYSSASLAAHVMGLAGDACLKEKGFNFLATDVIEKIPSVLVDDRLRERL